MSRRRTITPINETPAPDAFEREFGSTDSTTRGLRIYCGSKPVPRGKYLGTPLACFRRGFGVGSYVEQKKIPKRDKSQAQIEATTRALTIKQIAKDIETKGLLNFKSLIRLDNLSKDLIRSIALKLTGSRDEIRGYSNMTREQLINSLVERGWKR